ncbi:MAG: Transcriptional regulator, MarR family [Candidatus Uhrbacteria bacterium GW2011_GWE2_45_35]|uniref:Transcriptional regulator, MarR family n=2 Tax=Candidatus Uhriibacteriota TaxID=1752732 RepID=A0A0G1JJF4_9BACT|nr:MAG: Transcriptional regulator, MarR family [Candidatus Uhrbacteria bacterium GW2011_GWF2_44_350]KKU08024.1 MAG: Transcriptional regulator, MarR family [Candidatus Uhrbacteria bacterium GW2011_GWE2_45_35]HBR80184.1 hypothetical protein [Candidatus Uhrbacteria bacterium]HCU32090.1 hypothetical protein [Candidatus Uhrbacteria bacterium]
MTNNRTEDLVALFFSTHRLIHEKFWSKSEKNPVSFLRLRALFCVAHNQKTTMSNITEELCITPSSATSLIDNLVEEGFLERFAEASDRRVVCLKITNKGQKILDEGREQMSNHLKEVLSHLNLEDQETIIKILEKLNQVYQTS